jgi:hypothetical protein
MSHQLQSSSAQNRKLNTWFQKIEQGEIKLPRFQRHQAWDKKRIASLLHTIIHNLPLGVTLLLKVRGEEKFVSRYLESAPETGKDVSEHLLDGQQRLTSFWRAMHNNYEWEKYFVYVSAYNESDVDERNTIEVHYRTRWHAKDELRPLWCNVPREQFKRGLIPINLLCPGDKAVEYEGWIDQALEHKRPGHHDQDFVTHYDEWNKLKGKLKDLIRDLRETVAHYNLPYLELPDSTDKETALQVFINMNSNSKPLSQYDIIRAEIESVKQESLDDLEQQLHERFPNIEHYFEMSFLILATSALMQDKLPNQRGMWDMKKDLMVDNWELMERGLGSMAEFMEQAGIYDKKRLPTNAVLAVIAALFTIIPESLDKHGQGRLLLKRYLWHAFFTDRYENSAATSAFADYQGLKKVILGGTSLSDEETLSRQIPIFDKSKFELADADELLEVGWPDRENIRARGLLAITTKLGAFDIADGKPLTRKQLSESKRHYHHIFPKALFKDPDFHPNYMLNCVLISDKTNLNISAKDPKVYLKERFANIDEETVTQRLHSHLVPIDSLLDCSYDVTDPNYALQLKSDFDNFRAERSKLFTIAIEQLCSGQEITASSIFSAKVD